MTVSRFQAAVTSLGGHDVNNNNVQQNGAEFNTNVQEGRRVLHSCDPECDPQGCYGKGPTQCVACKHYRLDK